jgi:hypothetical protein
LIIDGLQTGIYFLWDAETASGVIFFESPIQEWRYTLVVS